MKYIYIGVSIVLQTQLRSGLYNSFLTRTPGSEGVRNSTSLVPSSEINSHRTHYPERDHNYNVS